MRVSWMSAEPATQFLLILTGIQELHKDSMTFALTMKENVCIKISYLGESVTIEGYVFGEDAFPQIMDLIETVHERINCPTRGMLVLRGEVRHFSIE